MPACTPACACAAPFTEVYEFIEPIEFSDPIPTHSWYGFNVHATKRSVAPRPYSLLTLPKDTSLQWTHRYDFSWRYDF